MTDPAANPTNSGNPPQTRRVSERALRPRSRFWILLVALVGAAAAAALLLHRQALRQAAARAPRTPPAIPVTTSTARRGDIGVHLDALGTATPLATVTVKTRVDGQLMSVKYSEGQMVHQGDLLAEIDPRPFQVQLEQAQAQLQRDQALLENARVDLDRYRSLFSRDAIPKQTLDTQVATVHQDEATVKNDQAQIANAKLQLVYSRVTSPISGRVGLRLVDPGNVVHASDPGGLAVITQLQPITVVFSISEDALPQLQRQIRAGRKLPVEALDRAQQTRIATGEVLTFDNQIDPTTGTIKVKAIFPNEDGALFPNQFVNARVLVDVHQGVTLVPAAAVQRNAQGAFVYLARADGTAAMQPVTLGAIDGEAAEIVKGLEPGQVIAVDNFDKLQDGARIAARPAPAGQRAEATARSAP